MIDDPTERRLRATLQDQADRVDSHLSGPELRRRAATSPTHGARRFAPVLATAAGVAAIAIAAAVIGTNGSSDDDRAPVQPGGRTTSTVSTPAPTTSARPPTTAVLPTLVVPSASVTGVRTATPTPPAVPGRTPVASPSIRLLPGRTSSTP